MANKIQIGSTAVVDQIKKQVRQGLQLEKYGITLDELVPSTDENYNVGEFLVKADKANDVYPENIIAFGSDVMITRQLVRYWKQPKAVAMRGEQAVDINKHIVVETIDRIRLNSGRELAKELTHAIIVDFVQFPYLELVFANADVTIEQQDEYVNFLCQYFDILHIAGQEYVKVDDGKGNMVGAFDQNGRPQVKIILGGLLATRNEEAKLAYEAYLASQPA